MIWGIVDFKKGEQAFREEKATVLYLCPARRLDNFSTTLHVKKA